MPKSSTKTFDVTDVPFNGLELADIGELAIESLFGTVHLVAKRRDGSLVHVWISRQEAERSLVPLKVVVEAV